MGWFSRFWQRVFGGSPRPFETPPPREPPRPAAAPANPSPPASSTPAPPVPPRESGSPPPTESRPARSRPADKPTAAETDPFDLGQYTPISNAELREALKATGAGPWMGRRDRIPPVDDPRTRLIDRSMVAYGLITPEELAEIHAAGAKMDRLKPDSLLLRQMAQQQALQAGQAEREARRAQARAEAEQRRRARAEAIAHRRATDIVYLGRGVSQDLARRTAQVERLEELGLPVLSTPGDVAALLEIDIPTLRWLAFHHEAPRLVHYAQFTIPKSSGGTRQLSAPRYLLARCQQRLLRAIFEQVPTHPAAHGFVKGRSTLTNATGHVGRDVLINCDLVDFFPSITWTRVTGLLRALGYSPCVAAILGLLCTESPRRRVGYAGQTRYVAVGPRCLPQGAATSPALSNLIAFGLDRRLADAAQTWGWTYTRYADDLTFSADGEAAETVGRMLARIRHVVQEESFELHPGKTRVQRPSRRQSVTGIVVNQQPGLPRVHLRRLRAILHRAKTEGLEAQNREGHPNFTAWLAGHLAYAAMVNPRQAAPLQQAFNELTGG